MNLSPTRLAALGPFKGVPQDDLIDLGRHIYGRKLARGEVLYHEGDPAKDAVIVLSGRLAVTIAVAAGSVSVGDMWPGDLVGDAALLDRSGHRNATVTATMDTECAVFSPDLLEILPQNRGVIVLEQHLLRNMSKRIRAANARMERSWVAERAESEPSVTVTPSVTPGPPPEAARRPSRRPTQGASSENPSSEKPAPKPSSANTLRGALLRILGIS